MSENWYTVIITNHYWAKTMTELSVSSPPDGTRENQLMFLEKPVQPIDLSFNQTS